MKQEGPSEELKHQGTDFSFRAVAAAVVGFVIVIAVLQITIWWLYRYERKHNLSRNVSRTLVETQPPIPPPPRLQVNPQEDLQEYLRRQQDQLKSYAWVSRTDGKVRIPIDRAMQLIAERQGQK